MPSTKNKVSPLLAAILSDKEASKKLREAIAKGEDVTIHIDGVTYRISTSDQSEPTNGQINNTPTPKLAVT